MATKRPRQTRPRFSHTPTPSQGKRDSYAQGLRPWREVAAIWNYQSGQRLSSAGVWFICRNAERKLRAALAALE